MNYYELFHQSHHFLQYSEDLEVFVINNDVNFDTEVSPFFSKKKFFHGRQPNPFLCKWPFSSEKTENGYLTKVLSITPEYERESLALKILNIYPPSEDVVASLLNFYCDEYKGELHNFFDFIEGVLREIMKGKHERPIFYMLASGLEWVNQEREKYQRVLDEIMPKMKVVERKKEENIEQESTKSSEIENAPNSIKGRKKLKWYASNTSLCELFIQLSKKNTSGAIPLDYTREVLAQFLIDSFDDLPVLEICSSFGVAEKDLQNVDKQVKLKWNASKSILYYLFAQLSDSTTCKGVVSCLDYVPPLDYTPKVLAHFLSESFDNLPKIETIHREIQRYSNIARNMKKKGTRTVDKEPPKCSISLSRINFEESK